MHRWLRNALLLGLVWSNLSCSLIHSICSGFHTPSLSFDHLTLQDVNLTGVTVNLFFKLENDNPIGLNIASLSYNFAVEGHSLISGHPPNGLKINPNGASMLEFPATVGFQGLSASIYTFLNKSQANYTASGSIGFNTPIGLVNIPLSHSGTFDVPKLPDIQPLSPQLNAFTLTGAHLTIPLQVKNQMKYSLPFNGMATNFTIGGVPVGGTAIGQQPALGSFEARVINLGVDVNFFQAGAQVASAIQSHQINLGYQGTITLGGLAIPLNISKVVPIH
jgi:LEA14-like dessication related protein